MTEEQMVKLEASLASGIISHNFCHEEAVKSSASWAEVEVAREIQQARFAIVTKPNVMVIGDTGPTEVQKFCRLDKEGPAMIRMAVERMGLTARITPSSNSATRWPT